MNPSIYSYFKKIVPPQNLESGSSSTPPTVGDILGNDESSTPEILGDEETSSHVNANAEIPIDVDIHEPSPLEAEINSPIDSPPHKMQKTNVRLSDLSCLERDPGLRLQIFNYHPDDRDKVRCAYIRLGPYQFDYGKDKRYPMTESGRAFSSKWFKQFPWLEYSPAKNAAFCHPCFIFNEKATEHRYGSYAYTVKGFQNFKKVNAGKKCSFLVHMGSNPNSPHAIAVRACDTLMKKEQHIDWAIERHTTEQVARDRLRLKVSIDTARWLASQACAFRGHNERPDSTNRGNFLEMITLLASYNEDVAQTVLQNAPGNAMYTSSTVQKEILSILARNVRNSIREEVGDSKFCIIVDEARDESKREQMALVLRFVDSDGVLRERFFDIVHVPDTAAATLKKAICNVLTRHNLNIMDIRGQGYDGASNMRGEWNGLQALFLKDCPYAYYVHCFAHRLQLALVAAAKEVDPVYEFFTSLSYVVNVVGSSCKRNDQLQAAQADNLSRLLAIGEIKSGRGLNQIGTLQRPADTRWSSHFTSVCSLIEMIAATCSTVSNVMQTGCTYTSRGDAGIAYRALKSFNFVFILHLTREIMGITENLCQMLQKESQDILNAMQMIKTTRVLLQNLREDGWGSLLEKVIKFCDEHDVFVPDMGSPYFPGISRRIAKNSDTHELHYRAFVFIRAIDSQEKELNDRFNEQTMELFSLSSSLDPRNGYKSFNVDNICALVMKFYPGDFNDQEKLHLKYELQHYGLDIPKNEEFRKVSTTAELCQELERTGKSTTYPLVSRVIRLVTILPVSTATSERAFSAMKLVKNRLRSKMGDDFLADSMVVYIEREIAANFSTDSLIDEYDTIEHRRGKFH